MVGVVMGATGSIAHTQQQQQQPTPCRLAFALALTALPIVAVFKQ
jgi:hypothetical protein